MEFSRQEYWRGLLSSSSDLPDPGIEAGSPALQADSLSSESPGKFHSNFQIYSVVLLTVVTMPSITSQGLIYFITRHLYLWPPSLTSPTFILWFWQPPICSMSCFFFFESTYKWDHIVLIFLWLISFSITLSKFIHIITNCRISLFFMAEFYM